MVIAAAASFFPHSFLPRLVEGLCGVVESLAVCFEARLSHGGALVVFVDVLEKVYLGQYSFFLLLGELVSVFVSLFIPFFFLSPFLCLVQLDVSRNTYTASIFYFLFFFFTFTS